MRDGRDRASAGALLGAMGFTVGAGSAPPDLLVVDEWTPEGDPAVVQARRAGVPTTVLAELVLARAQGPVVGVTGTAGKTSTCRALEWVLRGAGRPVAISSTARSANAWPDHSLADGCAADVVTIAELTSTHLCHMRSVHPDVAVVTTIRPDHVELHGSVGAYVAAKRRLVADLTVHDWLVVPSDDPRTCDLLGPSAARRAMFGADAPGAGDGAFDGPDGVVMRWQGEEAGARAPCSGTALRAALAAGAAAMALGVRPSVAARALAGMPGVPHRMQRIAGPGGVTIIDDTMAATPLKGNAAIEQAPAGPLVLVLGGDDSPDGTPVHASAEEDAALRAALAGARARADVVVGFGPALERVTAVIDVDAGEAGIDAALARAVDACPEGGTVLVSPMFPLRPDERARVAAAG